MNKPKILESILKRNESILNLPLSPKVMSYSLKEEFKEVQNNPNKLNNRSKDLYYIKLNNSDFDHYLIKKNYFNAAYLCLEEFNFYNNNSYSRLFSKTIAAFNLAINIEFSNKNSSIDTPTMISYFSLTRFFYAYRALESYRKFLYTYSGNENLVNHKDLISNIKPHIEAPKNEEPLDPHFGKLITQLRNETNFLWKEILELNKQKREGTNETVFNKIESYSADSFKINNPISLINKVRNSFLHSNIAASTGAGDPLVMFAIITNLTDLMLIEINEHFKAFVEKELNLKY